MFDLTVLDYIYVGVILASTVWATIRGGIYETVATLSWVAAAITARFVSPMLDGLLQGWFKLSDSTVGTLVASYFIVFFAILLIVSFINQKLRDKIQESIMNVTDHTLGVIFGIIRGVVVMGLVYWGMLWYYSDMRGMPEWIENARTRPLMQLTALKLDQWFIPGEDNRLLLRDIAGTREAVELYKNLINPAVADNANSAPDNAKPVAEKTAKPAPKKNASAPATGTNNGAPKATTPTPAKAPAKKTATASASQKTESKPADTETGYKSSERTALENQLLQIETAARASEQRAAARAAQQHDKSE